MPIMSRQELCQKMLVMLVAAEKNLDSPTLTASLTPRPSQLPGKY